MKVFLHVGMWKTGTTSIQETLSYAGNKKILEGAGFAFIEDKNHIPRQVSSSRFWVERATNMGETKEQTLKNIKLEREAISSQIIEANSKDLDIIISNEAIYHLTEKEINELVSFLKGFGFPIDFQVIFSVREKVALMVSGLQQLIKMNFSHEGLYEELNCYSKPIELLNKTFGKENVLIYTFEESVKKGVVESFCSKIGMSDDDIQEIEVIKSNESSSRLSMDIKEFMNLVEPHSKDDKRNLLRIFCNERKLNQLPGNKFTVNLETAKLFQRSEMDDILWLKENYGIDYSKTDLSKYPSELKPLKLTDEVQIELAGVYALSDFFMKSIIIRFLEGKGRETGDDTFSSFAKKLSEQIPDCWDVIRARSQSFVLWGAGGRAQYAVEASRENNIAPLFFVDNDPNKQGKKIEGIEIISPQTFLNEYGSDYGVIITASDNKIYSEIKNLLNKNGIEEVYPLSPMIG